ncbi:hypothetical protein NMG60_11014141 [Bertholletia excelsa]
MSATAMTRNHHRRLVTPVPPAPLKRKPSFKAPTPLSSKQARLGSPAPTHKPKEPDSSNQLLAGYLAHEFLTKGTLFGLPWNPARAEGLTRKAEPRDEKYQRYLEVSDLIKMDGAHFPGTVNPTQLARFLGL